jgi:hypothetical protein
MDNKCLLLRFIIQCCRNRLRLHYSGSSLQHRMQQPFVIVAHNIDTEDTFIEMKDNPQAEHTISISDR